MLDCEKIHQDLPLYVLGALDEAVHRDVELHLRSCGACRTVEAQYHTLTGQIAVGVDEAGAGVEWDNLQSKVFGAAKEELYAVRQPGWRLGWRRWVAVAAVLMLAPGLAAVILWHNTGAARREIAGTAPTRTASPELWHMAAGGGVVDPSSGDLAASVQGVFLASQNAPTGVVALEAVTGRQRWRYRQYFD